MYPSRFFPNRYHEFAAHRRRSISQVSGNTNELTALLDVAAERCRLVRCRGWGGSTERNVEAEDADSYADDSRQACHERARSNDDKTDGASESLQGIKVGLERMLRE